MKYTLEERLEIGRRIYEDEISKTDAAKEYDIGAEHRAFSNIFAQTILFSSSNLAFNSTKTETCFPFWPKSFQKENFSEKKENRNEKQAEK